MEHMGINVKISQANGTPGTVWKIDEWIPKHAVFFSKVSVSFQKNRIISDIMAVRFQGSKSGKFIGLFWFW